jgi:hypothetical protein
MGVRLSLQHSDQIQDPAVKAEFDNLVTCLQGIFNARPEGYVASHRSPGFSPILTDDPTQFLNGQGQYVSPQPSSFGFLVPGEPGEDGQDGVPGGGTPSGTVGPKGDTGATGPAGATFAVSGEDGDDGISIPGTPGQPGTAGAAGATGPAGIGSPGPPGDDGESDLMIGTPANTGVTPATYGSSTTVGQFTVNQYGLITAAAPVTITAGGIGGSTPSFAYFAGVSLS